MNEADGVRLAAASSGARIAAAAPAVARLRAVATAVPPHALSQPDVEALAAELFAERKELFARLRPAFAHAGIERRFSAVPLDWYRRSHGWAERHRVYVEHAVGLGQRVAEACFAKAGLGPDDIDAVVAVSTTGIATPSLDALLIERLGLRRDVRRLPIFGLGCAGGVLGLARAAALALAEPGSRVLLVVVELCGSTFRRQDLSKSNIIATVLFGDGAAGAIVEAAPGAPGPAITGWAEHTWPASLDVMGWTVEEDGFGVLFSRDIPALVQAHLPAVVERVLAGQGLTLSAIDRFVCHPGGAKVVAALEAAFGLEEGSLVETREVLRDYGNMSAPTVFFVLERARAAAAAEPKRPRRFLLSALGPGFTAAFLTLELR